ncbi:hypothetical protein FQA39_LY09612 [Lamprigera yunnana]|nr:hypothetical protein FQA39_LY09612 [Lamprigera yunnana]
MTYTEDYLKEKLIKELQATYVIMNSKVRFKGDTALCGFAVLVAILLRCITTLHPYSGQGKPPMFGDYEAQRHWMEITVNLPTSEWYHNTTRNDLQYWGLDYPPLTAYHSYLCGLVSSFINPETVELEQSKGYESEEHKLFMRYTVLLVDVVLFIPAVILYFKGKSLFGIVTTIFYPGLILIDHGHFQYNCVSLAFTLYAIACINAQRNILASIFFCLALNYKQMELYHSLPFFVYLLSTCIPKPGQSAYVGIAKLFKISLSVIITFIIIWIPFLGNFKDTSQVIHRLFPVARGVFEDKVANVWCAVNVLYKLRTIDNNQMFKLCTISTFICILPSSLDLFLRPNLKKFVLALINCSLAFFLFSFQVHEKTILVVALPVMLYLQIDPINCFWFLIISVFSMLPLLMKDELVIAYIALTLFYIIIFHLMWEYASAKGNTYSVFMPRYDKMAQLISDINLSNTYEMLCHKLWKNFQILYDIFKFVIVCGSLMGCVVITAAALILQPPHKFPDLFPLIISVYSCVHFEVVDESDGCGAKFSCIIVSDHFEGKSLLHRHRLVNSTLQEELKNIHAFSQKTYSPKQWLEQQKYKNKLTIVVFVSELHFLISAPGKVILYGEHSVVYDKLAIAASLDLRTRLHFTEHSDYSFTIDIPTVTLKYQCSLEIIRLLNFSSNWKTPDLNHDKLLSLAELFIKENCKAQLNYQQITSLTCIFYLYFGILQSNVSKGFRIMIDTDIVLGAGTGSSASFAVTVAAAFIHYLRLLNGQRVKIFNDEELNIISKWAYSIEKICHGKPSGIDNTICTYGAMVGFKRSSGTQFFSTAEFEVLLINSKQPRSTKNVVSNLALLREQHLTVINYVLDAMDAIAHNALTCLLEISKENKEELKRQYNRLGELTNMNHCMLQALGVSHSKLDEICNTLKEVGLCCKLTGAGGGGYAISIIPPYTPRKLLDDIIECLSSKGFEAILTKLGGLGVTVH